MNTIFKCSFLIHAIDNLISRVLPKSKMLNIFRNIIGIAELIIIRHCKTIFLKVGRYFK